MKQVLTKHTLIVFWKAQENNMLAKKVIEKFGYKWDDNWEDTNDIEEIVNSLVSVGETKKDIYKTIKSLLKENK